MTTPAIEKTNPPRIMIIVLIMIVALYLILGAAYAIRTPAWQAPDEPAHYNYIAQVAANGCCPLIEAGDYDQAYLDTLRGASFAPDTLGRLDSVQYEDHQPPLYYMLARIPYGLFNGSLTAVRLFSVILGAGVILCGFGITRAMFPARPGVALATAALIAFIPQHLAILSSVNNDALAELIAGSVLLTTIWTLKSGRMVGWLIAGILVGVGFFTKTTIYWLAGVVPLAILLQTPPPKEFIRRLFVFLVPALILGGLWWGRNLVMYGGADFLGLGAHDIVVVGQPRTAGLIAEVGAGEYLRRAVETTFNSYWGQFGWMARPLPALAYTLIGVGLIVSVVGWFLPRPHPPTPSPNRRGGDRQTGVPPLHMERGAGGEVNRAAWIVLFASIALTLAQMIIYNLTFIQFQGRYLYPALIPVALILALGWDWLMNWIGTRIGVSTSVKTILPMLIPAALVVLNVYVVWRELPALAP